MLRVCLCLGLVFYPLALFGNKNPSEEDIRSALEKIKKSLDSKNHLETNPLEGMDFESLNSRTFLYYYRALAYFQLAQNPKEKDKLGSLKKAEHEILQAMQAPYPDTKASQDLLLQIQKERMALAVSSGNAKDILSAIDGLPRDEKKQARTILLYAYALFSDGQESEFIHLARKYPQVFQNKALMQTTLPQIPSWDPLLEKVSHIDEHKGGKVKIIEENTPRLKLTRYELLQHAKNYLAMLEKTSYRSDADPVFKEAQGLFLSLLDKDSLTGAERQFRHSFEKAMHSFHPGFMEKLITSFWKRRETQLAERLSLSYLRNYLGHPSYPQVLYNLGRIQEDSTRYAQALSTYTKLTHISDDNALLENAMFRKAWVAHIAKKKVLAEKGFADYLGHYPEGRYASTCEYFLLRSKSGKKPDSSAIYAFIKKYSLNLYSLLLLDEYHENVSVLLSQLSFADDLKAMAPVYTFYKADLETMNKLAVFRELKGYGLRDEAVKILKSIPIDESDDFLALYLADQFHELHHANGEELTLARLAQNSETYRSQIPWKGLFPTYALERIQKVLKDLGSDLSPYLVLSVIRQESAFDPQARSVADAVGLMQLTPGTAKLAARALKMRTYSLLDEEDNLHLGLKTLSDLIKKYDNRLDYALASYNAGETISQLWIDLRGHLGPIEFIESIPYQETRLYIKNILRNYAIYRLIYDRKPTSLINYSLGGKSGI